MTIPRVAFFYWSGGPIPWLRTLSIRSFMRMHPEWRVVVGAPQDIEVPTGAELMIDDISSATLPPASRSDVWRWAVLSQFGGLYADTDIVFVRSVEPLFELHADAWITQDMGTSVWVAGRRWDLGRQRIVPKVAVSIGVLASRPGSSFYTRLYRFAKERSHKGDYQSHGTSLIAEKWLELTLDAVVAPIPGKAFYDGSRFVEVQRTWTDRNQTIQDHQYGVHWYGGSAASAAYAKASRVDDLPDGLVRKAITLALA